MTRLLLFISLCILCIVSCYDDSKYLINDEPIYGYYYLNETAEGNDLISIMPNGRYLWHTRSNDNIDSGFYKFRSTPGLSGYHLNKMSIILYGVKNIDRSFLNIVPNSNSDSGFTVSFYYEIEREKSASLVSDPETRSFDYILRLSEK